VPSRSPNSGNRPGRHAVAPFLVPWVSLWRAFVQNKANFLATALGTGLDCAKQTQFAPDRQPEPRQELIMRSKPNSPMRPDMGAGRGSHQRNCPLDLSRQANPTPGDAGWDEPTGTWDAGRMRQVNPISESGPAGPGADHAKQSQTWTGWGIWGGRISEANRAKQSQFLGVPGGTRPQDRGTQGRGAKQTQFGRADRPAGRSCETKPIQLRPDTPSIPLPYHSTIPIRCLSCETNPISTIAAVESRRYSSTPASAQNEPNFGGWASGRNTQDSTIPSFQHSDSCCAPITTMGMLAY
jgi:hypothetical protein